MTTPRIALCVIAVAFIAAEVVRPTHVPAKKSARGLIVHSQAVAGAGVRATLDPNLIADLPRIHPDAAGNVMCSRENDGSFRIFGTLAGSDPGSAVFVIRDGTRLGSKATVFGNGARPRDFAIDIPPTALGSGGHRLRVAIVDGDQRGFFLMPQTIAVTVKTSSNSSDDCRMLRRDSS